MVFVFCCLKLSYMILSYLYFHSYLVNQIVWALLEISYLLMMAERYYIQPKKTVNTPDYFIIVSVALCIFM